MAKFRTVLAYVFPPLTVLFGLLWLFKRGQPPPKPASIKDKNKFSKAEKEESQVENNLFTQTDDVLLDEKCDEIHNCNDEVEKGKSLLVDSVKEENSVENESSCIHSAESHSGEEVVTISSAPHSEQCQIKKQSSCMSEQSYVEGSVGHVGTEIILQHLLTNNVDQNEVEITHTGEQKVDAVTEEVIQKSVSSTSELNETPEVLNNSSQLSCDLISSDHQNNDTETISNPDRHCVRKSVDSMDENNLLNDIESQILLSTHKTDADTIATGCHNVTSSSDLKLATDKTENTWKPIVVNDITCVNNSIVEEGCSEKVSTFSKKSCPLSDSPHQSVSLSSDSQTFVLKTDTPVTATLDSRTSCRHANETETVIKNENKVISDIDQSNIINNNVSLTSPSHSSQNVQNNQSESSSPQQQKTCSPESSSYDSNSEASNDSGKGASVTEPPGIIIQNEITVYEFNFPSDLCGRLIGRFGKNINYIKDQSGATLSVRNNPYTPAFQICAVEGTQSEIDTALDIIKKKFPRSKFPNVDLSPLNQPLADNPLLMPEIMQVTIGQMNLPEGVSVDVVVSSIVNAGQIFIQQPTHPSFPSLERLNHFMIACYSQEGAVPPLPRPIEVGVICAAPMLNGWFRAQVVTVYDETDECDIRYVDYGGYATVQSSQLKQIRSDFMSLPFQAVECYMGNITPSGGDDDYFSTEAAAVLEELTQGKLLQAQVVARTEDSVPYVHVYQIDGSRAVLINREMVNRGVARWVEVFS